MWACLQTDVNGDRRSDSDANAYPASHRRALGLVKQAGAPMLAGDQHLGSLVRHGLNTFVDGPVQFVAPVGATAVANPRVSFATFRQAYPSGQTNVGDRNLKSEGYGLVRIDKKARSS